MKERLDVLLVNRGLAPSREKAKIMIMEGNVFVDQNREDKAGMKFNTDCKIEVHGKPMPYVSRGGFKLEKAMQSFPIRLDGLTCMDIGASTGGFTDCMLQNGAKKVYSVDVGYGQFAWKLRQDPRVVCMEKTNIRYVTPDQIGEPIDFASCDVSFISLTKILVPVHALLSEKAHMVCLIKPQFEAGRENVGKKGVVRDPKVHEDVIRSVTGFAEQNGFHVLGLDFSPIKGPEGNIEYLMYIERRESAQEVLRAQDANSSYETQESQSLAPEGQKAVTDESGSAGMKEDAGTTTHGISEAEIHRIVTEAHGALD